MAQARIGFGDAGVERDRSFEGRDRVLMAAKRVPGIAKIDVRFGVIGLPLQCPAKVRDGLVMPADGTQQRTQIVVNLRIVRLPSQRQLVVPSRLLVTLQPLQNSAEIIVAGRQIGVEGQRLLQRRHRALRLAGLEIGDAQKVERRSVARRTLEHTVVEIDRFDHRTLAMQLHRARQHLICGLGHQRLRGPGALPY
jgi:hypothetical protein